MMVKEIRTRARHEHKPLLVFESSSDSKCGECGADLDRHAWITLRKGKGALCLECADLDHLVFLPPAFENCIQDAPMGANASLPSTHAGNTAAA